MTRAALLKWVTLVGSGVVVSLVALPARADGTSTSATPMETELVARERPSTRSFYGWQILALGEAGGVVAAAALVLPESPMKSVPSAVGVLMGMPIYVIGGPAMHWSHGAFEKGLISLGANIVSPIVGGFIGQAVACGGENAAVDCGSRGFFTGFAIALVTVPIADALLLGWEDIPEDDPLPPSPVLPGKKAAEAPARSFEPRRRRVPQFAVAPAWSLGPRGELAFGVSGRF
jgi:hypothetical protein